MKHHYAISSVRGIPILLAVLCFLLLAKEDVLAYPTGITGYTTAGCNCHSPGQSSNTSLSFTSGSGSFTVAPGGVLSVTLTVAHSSQSAAGTDIGVVNSSNQNAGTLSPATGSGLSASGSELTHSSPKSISGGQASFAFTWTAPATPGTYTIRAAANAVNMNGSNSGDYYNTGTQTITVSASPTVTVTAPNGNEQWCAGGSQNITWTSSSITNVKIELSSDGGSSYPVTLVASTPAAAGSWTWNIPASQTVGDLYKVRISDASNAAVNDASNNNFSIKGATAIGTQPQAQVGCEGTAVSFSVVASGANLAYQWRKDGNNISGANSATYTINSPVPASAGSYDVIVNGSCGTSVTSNAATLTVRGRPTITTHPGSYSVCKGESATLSVTATGEGLTYQWRHEGTPVAGATESSYTIPSVTASQAGRYDVVVSGVCSPSATSNFGMVQLAPLPIITQQPQSQVACEGSPLSLTVQATGAMGYTWRKNGTAIGGATGPDYTIQSMSSNAEGEYSVTIIGLCENVTSQTITLGVAKKPAITQQPSNVNVTEGAAIMLSVTATGANLSYQWKKNGTVVNNATGSQLSIGSAAVSDAGSYTVLVSNGCGTITSATAVVSVTPSGPGPVLVLSETSLDFGAIAINDQKEMTLTIRNGGTENLDISAIALDGDNSSDFTVLNMPTLPLTLQPGSPAIELTIRFSPSAVGARTANLAVTSNAPGASSVGLAGVGTIVIVSPVAGFTAEFGTLEIGTSKTIDIVVKNTGIIPAQVPSVNLGGTNENLFSVVSVSPVTPTELAPGEEMTVKVMLAPVATGNIIAQLFIHVDGMDTPVVIDLTGNAIQSTSVGEEQIASIFTVSPNPITNNATIHAVARTSGGELSVVDTFGRLVRHFGRSDSAEQTIQWDGRDDNGQLCAAGIYRIVLSLNGTMQTLPVVLVR